MIDLEEIAVTAVRKMVDDGTLQKGINDLVQKAVSDAVSRAMSSYSDFGKALTAKLEQALVVDFGRLGLEGYNATVLDVVQRKLDAAVHLQAKKQIAEDLEKMLESPPAEIKLTELVREFKDYAARHPVNYSKGPDESITLLVKRGEDWHDSVCFSRQPHKSEYQCDYRLYITGERHIDKENLGRLWRVDFGTRELKEDMFMGELYGFERRLFQMHSAKTRLIFDADPHSIDLSVERPREDED